MLATDQKQEAAMNKHILITLMRIAFAVLLLALVETARAETPADASLPAVGQIATAAR